MKKKKSPKVVKKEIDPFADKPIAIPESIDMENHVIATYWIQADKGMGHVGHGPGACHRTDHRNLDARFPEKRRRFAPSTWPR